MESLFHPAPVCRIIVSAIILHNIYFSKIRPVIPLGISTHLLIALQPDTGQHTAIFHTADTGTGLNAHTRINTDIGRCPCRTIGIAAHEFTRIECRCSIIPFLTPVTGFSPLFQCHHTQIAFIHYISILSIIHRTLTFYRSSILVGKAKRIFLTDIIAHRTVLRRETGINLMKLISAEKLPFTVGQHIAAVGVRVTLFHHHIVQLSPFLHGIFILRRHEELVGILVQPPFIPYLRIHTLMDIYSVNNDFICHQRITACHRNRGERELQIFIGNGFRTFYHHNSLTLHRTLSGRNHQLFGKVLKTPGHTFRRRNNDSKVVLQFRIDGSCQNKTLSLFHCIIRIVFYHYTRIMIIAHGEQLQGILYSIAACKSRYFDRIFFIQPLFHKYRNSLARFSLLHNDFGGKAFEQQAVYRSFFRSGAQFNAYILIHRFHTFVRTGDIKSNLQRFTHHQIRTINAHPQRYGFR